MRYSSALPAVALFSFATASTSAAFQCAVETQSFSPSSGLQGAWFGATVALQGGIAAVGAPATEGTQDPSAYVYERDALGNWSLARQLLPAFGPLRDDVISVVVDGATVIVGSSSSGLYAPQGGAVHIYARDQGGPGNWGEVTHFAPASAGSAARFGVSLALSGDVLAVGAPRLGAGNGSVYLYRRDASSASGWTLEREIGGSGPDTTKGFGLGLALSGDLLAATGNGDLATSTGVLVELRGRDVGGTGNWGLVKVLRPPTGTGGFNTALALDGDRLAASAPFSLANKIHLFRRDEGGAGQWGLERTVSFPTDANGFFRADALVLSGDWLVAGDPLNSANNLPEAGEVCLFGRDVGGPDAWGQVARLFAATRSSYALFGGAVALQGDELLVGAHSLRQVAGVGDVRVLDLARAALARWRNDSGGLNADVYTVAAMPRLGTNLVADVDVGATGHSALGPGLAMLVAFAHPAEIPLAGARVLLGRGLLGRSFANGPLAHFTLPLPPSSALCGLTLTTQARITGSGAPMTLSNAQDLRLGLQ